jgi:hypothetical protein
VLNSSPDTKARPGPGSTDMRMGFAGLCAPATGPMELDPLRGRLFVCYEVKEELVVKQAQAFVRVTSSAGSGWLQSGKRARSSRPSPPARIVA